MKNRELVVAAAAAWILVAAAPAQTANAVTAAEPLTATGLLASCVACLPHEPLTLSGTPSVRKQRGIVVAEHRYRLKLDWGATPQRVQCDLLDDQGATQERPTIVRRDGRPESALRAGRDLARQTTPALTTPVCGTDITWLDLTLDFLWWPDVRLDGTDTVRGRECCKVVARPPVPLQNAHATARAALLEVHAGADARPAGTDDEYIKVLDRAQARGTHAPPGLHCRVRRAGSTTAFSDS